MNALASPSEPVSGNTGRRTTWLRGMAWCCATLVLLIIGISAHLRLSQALPQCDPWPECGRQLAPASTDQAGAAPAGKPLSAARAAHRATASAALLVVLAIVGLALTQRPIPWAQGGLALGLLGLALFLAVLGMMAGASTRPAVVLGNLLGGFAMFALCVRLAVTASPQPTMRAGEPTARWWMGLAIALLLLQIALGGLASATLSGPDCLVAGTCDAGAGAWPHTTHRLAGFAVCAVLLALSWRAWRLGHRRIAVTLAGLIVALAGLGVLLVALALPLALVLAHNLGAALLLALLVGTPVVYFSGSGPGA